MGSLCSLSLENTTTIPRLHHAANYVSAGTIQEQRRYNELQMNREEVLRNKQPEVMTWEGSTEGKVGREKWAEKRGNDYKGT